MSTAKKKFSYDESIAEVEQILERLQTDEMPLDTMLADVKRAVELLGKCKGQLTEASDMIDRLFEEDK